MTAYYLIPTKWVPKKRCQNALVTKEYDTIRLVECHYSKVDAFCDAYEKELNNGELFSIEAVATGKTLYDVFPTPFSQARDYSSFPLWPCNKDIF